MKINGLGDIIKAERIGLTAAVFILIGAGIFFYNPLLNLAAVLLLGVTIALDCALRKFNGTKTDERPQIIINRPPEYRIFTPDEENEIKELMDKTGDIYSEILDGER